MVKNVFSSRITAPSHLKEQEQSRWESLCETVGELASPFLTVHYSRAVEATGITVRVCVLYRNGQPCGFFPFQFDNALAAFTRSAGPVGGIMTDYVGLIAEPGVRLTPAQLLKLTGLNGFSFSHLDEGQLAYGLVAGQPRVGLRLRLAADAPLASQLRDQHRYLKDSERCERQLIRDLGPIEFVFDQRESQTKLLDELIEHKRAQYARTGVPDSLADDWTRRLLHQLAATRHATCQGQLSTLHAGGKWLASHFGMVGSGILHHWMPVYNPEFSRYAPGRLLMHRMIEACPAAGLHVIDHGEGDSLNKRQVSNEEHQYYRGGWHNNSLMSFATRSYKSLKWRLES
jgi:CelD/BcsL family acetyltransferase involved in cellulose biosynthesis